MNLARKSKITLGALAVVAAFSIVWCIVSIVTPPWSDEPRNLAAAKGLAILGKPILWDFSTSQLSNVYYSRGMAINYPLAFLYKHGLHQLVWARLVPLAFVLLTLLFWIVYLRYKRRLDGTGIALLVIFFLGQPMVVEHAAYIRIYAPLGLVFSIASACLWELKDAWFLRRWGVFAGLAALCLLGIWIPQMDAWQAQHVPQLLLAAVMLNSRVWRVGTFFIRRPLWALLVFVVMLGLGSMLAPRLDGWISWMAQGWGINNDLSYETYWDNIAGLVRFFWAVNVMLVGLRWIFIKPDGRDFFRWLYLSGLLGGILLGLFTSPKYIFFSRYFYVPIIALTVGFAGMCAQEDLKPFFKRSLIAGYLLMSLLFTFVNFYFGRSNMPVAMDWLKKNMGAHDCLLAYSPYFEINGGAELVDANTYLLRDYRDNPDIDSVIDFILRPGVIHVYVLINDYYQFRDILYEKTTGSRRWAIKNRIADYLNSLAGHEVLNTLRECSLKEFDPYDLAADLVELKKKPPFQPRLWRLIPNE